MKAKQKIGHANGNLITLFVPFICLCLTGWIARGAENEWTGEGETDLWHDPANWSAGVPVAGQDVRIDAAPDVCLNEATAALGSFYLGIGRTLTFENWDSALEATEIEIAGTLTHATQTATEPDPETGEWIPEHRILLKGVNLNVTSDGLIDANARGWGPTLGPGAGGNAGGNDGGGGGGYGGRGGRGNASAGSRGAVYGSALEPNDPGSGGGRNATRWPPGAGGGQVNIFMDQHVRLDGQIRANGGNGSGRYCGGGSGGGIFITCATFDGDESALLSVRGGNGNSSLGRAGAGGGGRIAIWMGVPEAHRRAYVDHGDDEFVALADLPGNYQGVIATNAGTGNTSYPGEPGTLRMFRTTLVNNLVIDGDPDQYGEPAPWNYGVHMEIFDGTWITNRVASPVDEGNGLRRACIGWELYADDTLLDSDMGTQAVFQVNSDLTLVWRWTNEYWLATQAGVNGNLLEDQSGWYRHGDTVAISAGGTSPYVFSQWTGDVTVDNFLDLPLDVPMQGPRAITAHFMLPWGEMKTLTGPADWADDNAWSPPGMPGVHDDARIESGLVQLNDPVRCRNLTLDNSVTLRFSTGAATLFGRDVVLEPGVTISHLANADWPASETNGIHIVARNLTVAHGALLNAGAAGWPSTTGPGAGRDASSNNGGAGGGYGGKGGGGLNNSGGGGSVYGDPFMPLEPGSGGGRNSGSAGAGGGFLRLIVDSEVHLDGEIRANGGGGTGQYSGGGSGGGVFIRCRTLTGSVDGLLRANGGNGNSSLERAGGGGGGRIAIWIDVPEMLMHRFLDEGDDRHLVIAEADENGRFHGGTHESFEGLISVVPGRGWPDRSIPETSDASPGTIRVITSTLKSGTVLMLR